ncbi:MAG: alanine--tRNA ligase [Lachnospiraceae bacterium]|nr:alanine--tRNA ligase [Lachnospiraceae bacterium]
MKKITSNELRKAWIDFYTKRGPVDCQAVSLVSDGSTGVMFNVAGMQPLMSYLLGKKHPLGTRLCNIQGCVRTNDIDSVGDQSHGTFFEMMGSWSLGDYFKEDRCKWSFELLTEVFGFDADHLAATVFAGDENAPRDEEGAACRIASGFRKDRIFYLPAEDNWWGLEFGPCGPDSEMFYVKDVPDCGPDCGPGCHCGKYTEIGNDVFMQYEKHQDGTLTPLAKKNVDTGWGLERNLAFLNGTSDVYKTDIHAATIAYIEKASGKTYDTDPAITRSMRIIADHIRTAVMLIGDEARLTPSNAGPGYVLRRLIRRAVRHARVVGIKRDDLIKCAAIYIDEIYSESYPNLVTARSFVLDELKKEIERFESTLENGMKELTKILSTKKESGDKTVSGKEAFYLYDTFGFPLELTIEMAGEEGLTVDEKGFEASMNDQKELARRGKSFSQKDTSSVFDSLDESVTTTFLGYDALGCDGQIVAIASDGALVDEIKEGSEATVITDKTTFYGTMGGQVGDIGEILGHDGSKFVVTETVHVAGGRTAHVGKVTSGSFKKSDKVSINVDKENRAKTCRNHSATHLLQAALREVLGNDAHQAGSFQDPERTRFDFSYGQAMTKEQIAQVEAIVNDQIEKDLQVSTDVMSIEEAKKTGAMALFGEKYGDSVRVVSMGDFSKELCGGTHVKNTGDIAAFKILSESGVAAGVRRIEAITGRHVTEHYQKEEDILYAAAAAAKSDIASLPNKITSMQEEIKTLMAENEKLKAKVNSAKLGDMSDKTIDCKGLKLISTSVKDVDMNGLRDLGDKLKAQIGEGVVFLASAFDGKACLLAMATDGVVARGAHAGNLIKEAAVLVGGGGGGRPNMAQAGGKNPAAIDKAVAAAADIVMAQIKD